MLLFLFSGNFLFAQEKPDYYLKEIIVTANRFPATLADINRSITIIKADEIQKAPAHSVEELLEYLVGVDIQTRGAFGVQSDLTIRGSSFEQTLVLIDGIKVSDPQTGHHNLNIPLTLNDIKKIEILKGQGSRLYGPNAFGGVINIITKKANENSTNLHISFGEHDFFQGDVSLSFPFSSGKNLFSFSRKKSKGYRPNTDFDISTFYYTMSFDFNLGKLDLSASYLDKKFGAYCFYSDQYPNEWESINTFFFNASACFQKGGVTVFPKLHYRKKNDDFILDRERPDWFRNKHKTDDYGFEIQGNVNSKLGASAFGFEVGRDEINSSNLGDHTYQKAGIFWEHRFIHNQKVIIVPGISSYYNSIWGWNHCPGMDFGYQLSEKMKIFGNIGKSFRVPTFTELYYQSPANIGNQNLKPERAWTYEAGLNFSKEHFSAELALFHRNGFNLIDWVRDDPEQLWKAQNITRVATNGGEINVRYFPNFKKRFLVLSKIQVTYAYLNSNRKTYGFISKYALNYLRHKLQINFDFSLPAKLYQSWKLRFEDRVSYKKLFILDSKITWDFNSIDLYLEATNLLNTEYMEAGFVPMPGKWLLGGIRIKIDK